MLPASCQSGDFAASWNEEERSAALASYGVLDTPREQDFDDIARVASEICGTPIAVVNLVDTTRQFFKAEVGLGVRSTPLETAFCSHALLSEEVMVVTDAEKDPRFARNPLVTGEPHLKAYAGALLKTPEGLPIGTVCVLDYQTRTFTEKQLDMLRFLARQAMVQLDLRRTIAAQRLLLLRARAAELQRMNFERLVRQASDFIGMADAKGQVVFLNDAARRLVGLDELAVLQTDVMDYIAPEDQLAFRADVVPMLKAGQSCERELSLRNLQTGETVPALYTIFPLHDGPDLLGYGVVAKDIYKRRLEEDKRSQVMDEATHRIKNTLAVVQAIVSQSLSAAQTLEGAREAISKRIAALARAQDILTTASGPGADISDVVNTALAPHDAGQERLALSGPPVALSAGQALGLSLALHELATNAAKYGALSGSLGRVDISWSMNPEGLFRFDWQESGGPPVTAPENTGFGSKLIRRMVGPYFEGRADLSFPPTGACFLLEGKVES